MSKVKVHFIELAAPSIIVGVKERAINRELKKSGLPTVSLCETSDSKYFVNIHTNNKILASRIRGVVRKHLFS